MHLYVRLFIIIIGFVVCVKCSTVDTNKYTLNCGGGGGGGVFLYTGKYLIIKIKKT